MLGRVAFYGGANGGTSCGIGIGLFMVLLRGYMIGLMIGYRMATMQDCVRGKIELRIYWLCLVGIRWIKVLVDNILY